MLAQLSTNLPTGTSLSDTLPLHLTEWLGSAAFAMWLLLLCIKFKKEVFGKPPSSTHLVNQPLEVRAAVEFVRQEECRARHNENSQAIAELRQSLKDSERVAAIQRKSMYDKIDQARAEVNTKIDAMPGQIVTQLLNTKQLWRGHS